MANNKNVLIGNKITTILVIYLRALFSLNYHTLGQSNCYIIIYI